MCGRYTLTTPYQMLKELFELGDIPAEVGPRFNIAPTQQVAAIPNEPARRLALFRWGLVPFWAKDPKIGSQMINARAETVAEKPAFRNALRKRRCLILADGFYEWRKEGARKTPTYIRLSSHRPFAFAGLWESWKAPDGSSLLSCAIITTSANELMKPIHDRMPVILPPERQSVWLDPAEQDASLLTSLLAPFDSSRMEAYPVSTRVNSPANDAPDLLVPAAL
jgi:putative SOS response-associated peptidase YedK